MGRRLRANHGRGHRLLHGVFNCPLLVIVIGIAGLFFGPDAASSYIYAQLVGLLGLDGAAAVRDMVERASRAGEGAFATFIGVTLLAVGATTVFAELQSDLDRIWKAPALKRPDGLWGLLRSRVLSFGLVVSVAFVLLVSLVFSAALAAFTKWWSGAFERFEWVLNTLDIVVSFAAITVVFALMYKILPRVKIGWRDVWIGAAASDFEQDRVRLSQTFDADGPSVLQSACKMGLEGIIAKRLNAPYRSGARTDTWQKVKCQLRQEFVAPGRVAMPSTAGRSYVRRSTSARCTRQRYSWRSWTALPATCTSCRGYKRLA